MLLELNRIVITVSVAMFSSAVFSAKECNVVSVGDPPAKKILHFDVEKPVPNKFDNCSDIKPIDGDVYLMYRTADEVSDKIKCEKDKPKPCGVPGNTLALYTGEQKAKGGKQAGENANVPPGIPYGIISSPNAVPKTGATPFQIQGGALSPGNSYKVIAANYSGSFKILGAEKAAKLQTELEQLKSKSDLDDRSRVVEQMLILSNRGLEFEAKALFDKLQ